MNGEAMGGWPHAWLSKGMKSGSVMIWTGHVISPSGGLCFLLFLILGNFVFFLCQTRWVSKQTFLSSYLICPQFTHKEYNWGEILVTERRKDIHTNQDVGRKEVSSS